MVMKTATKADKSTKSIEKCEKKLSDHLNHKRFSEKFLFDPLLNVLSNQMRTTSMMIIY